MKGSRPRAGSLFSASAPSVAAGRTERLERSVLRTRLPHGPVVISERMETVRSVAVGLWFRQGSVHESVSERGISHLLEHMVFKGTGRRSARELAGEIERVGGAMDAYTGHESTAYQARVPDEHLGLAVDVLADLAFHPVLRRRDLELERQVVLEELAGLEESPEDVAFELYAAELFGSHPYGARVAGHAENVRALELGGLKRLHETAYRGANSIVAAAGRLDHQALVEAVEAAVPGGGGVPQGGPPAPEGRSVHRQTERCGGRQVHLVAGGTTVSHSDPLRYAMVLVDQALGAGMSSRLFQRIREERGLAYTVYSFASFYGSGGHAGAYLSTGPERSRAAREALLEELRRVAEAGLDPEELDATKRQLKGQVMLALESPVARMNRLAAVELYGEEYRTLDEIGARIERVDAEAVRRAAGLLHPDRLTVLELLPT